MADPNRSLEELVADFRAGKLKLPALFDALGARGAVSAAQHASDVAWLEHARDADGLDANVARALLGKLASLQPATPVAATPADADDATQVHVSPRAAPPVDDDATRVQNPAQDADGTVVQPRAPTADDESATVVHPASRPETTHTEGVTTGTSSSLNTSTWERVAGETAGEYATVGMLLKGRFLLEREIGRGGMGVVYLARDERKVEARDRDPYVAVKVLNDEFRRHPDSLIALQREARRSQQLAHDNIVRVYDFDKDRTIVFMTMEYIDGTNLKTLIREQAYDGMPLAKARPLIEGMAWALKRAHSAGVVHSDFKPGNVMVTKEGVAKVFDFGIARAGKFQGEVKGEETVFDAGTLGALTPAYASLEMLQGAEPTPADDIYALGCVTYELLTGKHPYGKVSAEVAMKEGRTPPRVRGLTKRQNQTLQRAVAFRSEQRLQSAVQFIDGLREVSWSERARPLLIYGGIGVIVLAAAGWGTYHYVEAQHLARVVARFNPANPGHYANEQQAFKTLEALGSDTSKRIVSDHGNAIEAYLLSRLNTYWDPTHQRYNYAGVQRVFQVRDQLKLFSPQLDIRRTTIEQQRNGLLNTLDTQLSQRIAAGAIFQNQPDNVVGTLDEIRAIDPTSALLDNGELKLKYDIAIGQSLDAGDLPQAQQRAALAERLFPQSKRLKQRAAQVAALVGANAAAAKLAAHEQTVPEARAALAKLAANPSLTPEWQAAAGAAFKVLKPDHTPASQQLVASAVAAIAREAATATQPSEVQRASSVVALGLIYAPTSPALLAQQTRLAGLQQQQQAQLAAESAAAEVAARIESVKRAAAAHDISKASDALNRIRVLQPNNAFLTTQGPQLLAEAYLGQAENLVSRGAYQQAADTLQQGLKAVGNRPELRNAQARDTFVASLMHARRNPPDAAGLQKLRNQLAALKRADADGVLALEAQLKLHGALPEGSLAGLLDSLKPAVTATAAAPPAATPTATAPTPPAVAASKPTTGKAVPTTSPVAGVQPGVAPAPGAQADPCARPGLAGKGRICSDSLGGDGRGPALVVVPGAGGGKPFALSRTDVTVGEFNRFCTATHQCSAKGGAADLPVSDIPASQAKAYAAWLTQKSGFTYRLPTDAEWMHAAAAGQGWTQSPDSNCIPPSAGGGGGPGGPISARGREPNPWGLVNMTGNVWQWVTSGGALLVRGGSFNSYWSDCTTASHRADSGKAQPDVGFRILREIK
ncbi:MAG TPA: bifunctional serine/threonine-protein kinase/formylglycine-generating enzyme family protein [Rhodanobacteraceae bacterium]